MTVRALLLIMCAACGRLHFGQQGNGAGGDAADTDGGGDDGSNDALNGDASAKTEAVLELR